MSYSSVTAQWYKSSHCLTYAQANKKLSPFASKIRKFPKLVITRFRGKTKQNSGWRFQVIGRTFQTAALFLSFMAYSTVLLGIVANDQTPIKRFHFWFFFKVIKWRKLTVSKYCLLFDWWAEIVLLTPKWTKILIIFVCAWTELDKHKCSPEGRTHGRCAANRICHANCVDKQCCSFGSTHEPLLKDKEKKEKTSIT